MRVDRHISHNLVSTHFECVQNGQSNVVASFSFGLDLDRLTLLRFPILQIQQEVLLLHELQCVEYAILHAPQLVGILQFFGQFCLQFFKNASLWFAFYPNCEWRAISICDDNNHNVNRHLHFEPKISTTRNNCGV